MSFFGVFIVGLVHLTALNLMTVMLFVHAASIWLTLFAAWKIADSCFASRNACYGAVSLLALCLTIPVAGTSLFLMDPYVTARSISTPCSLLGLAFMLEAIRWFRRDSAMFRRQVTWCIITLAVATVIHPLMATYALGCLLFLICASLDNARWRALATLGVCLMALIAAGAVPPGASGARLDRTQVAQTRAY